MRYDIELTEVFIPCWSDGLDRGRYHPGHNGEITVRISVEPDEDIRKAVGSVISQMNEIEGMQNLAAPE